MCGGPSRQQKEAAAAQTDISNTLSGIAKGREAFQGPFLKSRVQGGLPFLNQFTDFSGGALARSIAPQRAQLLSRLNRFGTALPSGFREQTLTDLGTRQARAFDDQIIQGLLLDEETRARAAGLANPLGFFTGAQQGFGSILNMPQQPNPLGSILGGAVGGLIGLA